jgi:hypothetical protein
MPNATDATREVVVREIEQLLAEEGRSPGQVTEEDGLIELGLDSLLFAVLITRLEISLGDDPFLAIGHGGVPRTVGELVQTYVSYRPGP